MISNNLPAAAMLFIISVYVPLSELTLPAIKSEYMRNPVKSPADNSPANTNVPPYPMTNRTAPLAAT